MLPARSPSTREHSSRNKLHTSGSSSRVPVDTYAGTTLPMPQRLQQSEDSLMNSMQGLTLGGGRSTSSRRGPGHTQSGLFSHHGGSTRQSTSCHPGWSSRQGSSSHNGPSSRQLTASSRNPISHHDSRRDTLSSNNSDLLLDLDGGPGMVRGPSARMGSLMFRPPSESSPSLSRTPALVRSPRHHYDEERRSHSSRAPGGGPQMRPRNRPPEVTSRGRMGPNGAIQGETVLDENGYPVCAACLQRGCPFISVFGAVMQ